MSHSDAMILLFLITALSNRTHAACSLEGRNVLCQADFNTAECDWDDGDCCEATCTPHYAYPSRECGENTPFDCKNPSYAPTEATQPPTPSPTICTVPNATLSSIGNAVCDDEFNNANCQYDGGDCCSESCTDSQSTPNCGASGFHCKDPDYMTPETTQFVDSLLSIGGEYKATSSDLFCLDHGHDSFAPVGNWALSNDEDLTFDIPLGEDNGPSDYYEDCLVNYTKSSCEAQEFLALDQLHIMTYCCALNVWVIGEFGEDPKAPVLMWYASTKSGDINGLTTWYGVAEPGVNGWDDEDYKTFDSVRFIEGDCATTGLIVAAVFLVIFLMILIFFCYKLGIRNCGSVMDAFEKQAARIELIIIGICFGDSFISSLFISIPMPLTVVSKGIVVMLFALVSLSLFGVRMYVSKAHILESESIGSLADFTFDLGVGLMLVFMYVDVAHGDEVLFAFLLLVGTYAGVVEEFLQLLAQVKNDKLQKSIEWYLDHSGRVISTVNMLLLFIFGAIYSSASLGAGFAVFLCIWSFIMLCATIYSWYAYVGCCGRGGHKKPHDEGEDKGDAEADGTGGEDKGDEEAKPPSGGDKAEGGDAKKAEDDKDDPEDGGGGRAESNI